MLDASDVADALPAVTVAPVVPALPEIEYVVTGQLAEKLTPLTFAPLTVTEELAGVNVQPLLEGVTVYVPFARPESV